MSASDDLIKLAIFELIGKGVAGTGRRMLSGIKRLAVGKPVTEGVYADLARKRIEAQGRTFHGIHRVPRGVKDLSKKTDLTDAKKWKSVDKAEFDKLRSSGNLPEEHFAKTRLEATGEDIYKVRNLALDPKSVLGFAGKHPGKVFTGALAVGLMWDPVTQTYKRSTDTMSGRGPSQGGYYYPSQG